MFLANFYDLIVSFMPLFKAYYFYIIAFCFLATVPFIIRAFYRR